MIGLKLGSWVIEEEIGRGGMGTVYRARRAADGGTLPEQAAIKVLAAELAVELGFQQRFQREIDILRTLNHPQIVRFLESGSQQGRFWFAMEFVAGRSYEDIRLAQGRVPWTEVLELAWRIAPALKHAHDRGVVHRDIKPSNLLQIENPEGPPEPLNAKLTDFGIASLFASPHLTVTGGVIGTPEYLSPEQAAGKPVTRRSDLYSLGVVLYTLVTGTTPFTGEPLELLHKHRYGQFDRPSRLVPDLHHDFEDVICDLLAKEPEKRPSDAGVLHRRLDSLRRKLERQATGGPVQDGAPMRIAEVSGRPGPATLMSQLMREELEAQNRGGPVQRLFNHPAVVVLLFVLCVGTLAWTFWPASAESLYQRGAAMMASPDPHDWQRAWEKYLGPLEEKFPGHAYREEVDAFRRRLDDYEEEDRAEKDARGSGGVGEGRWFYERGMRLARQGKPDDARAVWEALVAAYADVPSERPWVRRAEKKLAERGGLPDEKRTRALEQALERARTLEAEGEKERAEKIRAALKGLYRDDPEALKLIGR